MPELKHTFLKGRMNKDLDERLVDNGEYRDALNVEVLTSEGSNIGALQTCLGNSQIVSQTQNKLDLFPHIAPSEDSSCVGSIVDNKNNSAYWFIAGGEPGWVRDPVSNEIYNRISEDLIVEYNSDSQEVRSVIADVWKVRARFGPSFAVQQPDDPSVISTLIDPRTNNVYPAMPGFGMTVAGVFEPFTRIYVENTAGIRPGMEVRITGFGNVPTLHAALTPTGTFVITTVSKNVVIISTLWSSVQSNGTFWSAWYSWFFAAELVFSGPKGERVLNFNKNNHITGINIIDDMLFWTDDISEPKKVNIPRGKQGQEWVHAKVNPHFRNNTTHTKLIVNNNDVPKTVINGIPIPLWYVGSRVQYIEERHITNIKKGPLTPPKLDMSYVDVRVDSNNIPQNITNTGWMNFYGTLVGNFGLYPVGTTTNDVAIGGNPIMMPFDWLNGADWRTGDILLLTDDPTADPDTFTDYKVKLLVINSDSTIEDTQLVYGPSISGGNLEVEILEISNTLTDVSSLWFARLESRKSLYELKFPKFGYRYKYEDGEYSSFSPFSEIAFLPGDFDYHPKEGYNLGMENQLKTLKIIDFIPKDIPVDVVEVDILYKESDSPNIYTVKTFQPTDTAWTNPGTGNHHGSFQVDLDLIQAAVPSSQLLRPWDNVPIKAKAQEISGNRLIYGNYVQSYDLKEDPDDDHDMSITLSTYLRSFGTEPGEPSKSLKSLRSYQVGVLYKDIYGRETPVFSSEDSVISIEKKYAVKQNKISAQILSPHPYWAESFKYFVKETSGEYYNLAMDRWYDAADENIWLSFPSEDRNKVDDETTIYLKKGEGNYGFVEQVPKYKILAIKNEAPDYIKTVYTSMGFMNMKTGVGTAPLSNTGFFRFNKFPLVGRRSVLINGVAWEKTNLASLQNLENTILEGGLTDRGTSLVFRIMDGEPGHESTLPPTTVSEWYDITNIACVDAFDVSGATNPARSYSINIEDPETGGGFGNDVLFATGALDVNTNIQPGTHIEIGKKTIENKPEFDGRFFVKILSDGAVQNNIIGRQGDATTFIDFRELGVIDTKYFAGPDYNPSIYDPAGAHGLNSGAWFEDYNAQPPDLRANRFNDNPPPTQVASVSNWFDIQSAGTTLCTQFGGGGQFAKYLGLLSWEGDATRIAPVMSSSSAKYFEYNLLFAKKGRWDISNPSYPSGYYKDSGLYNDSNTPSERVYIRETAGSVAHMPPDPSLNLQGNTSNMAGIHAQWGAYPGQLMAGLWPSAANQSTMWMECRSQANTPLPYRSRQKWEDLTQASGYGWFIDSEMALIEPSFKLPKADTASITGLPQAQIFRGTGGKNKTSILRLFPTIGCDVGQDTIDISYVGMTQDANTGSGGQTAPAEPYAFGQHNQHFDWGVNSAIDSIITLLETPGTMFRFINDPDQILYEIGSTTSHYLFNYDLTGMDPDTLTANHPWQESDEDWENLPTLLRRTFRLSLVEPGTTNPKVIGEGSTTFTSAAQTTPLPFSPLGVSAWGGATTFFWDDGSDNAGWGGYTTAATNNGITEYTKLAGGADEENGIGIQFVELHQRHQRTTMPHDPAVWETEPKEEVGLDVYYEISPSYPVIMNSESDENYLGINISGGYSFSSDVVMAHCPHSPFNHGVICTSTTCAAIESLKGSGHAFNGIPTTIAEFNIPQKFGAGDILTFLLDDGSEVSAAVAFNSGTDRIAINTGTAVPSTLVFLDSLVHGHKQLLNWHNCYSFGNGVESNRIRDLYNAVIIDKGVKVSTTLAEQYKQERRGSGLIFSGIYNSKMKGINRLNQFIMAEPITKELNPTYGSIQKLHARDTDLVTFCEDKVLRVLSNKDALYNADGTQNLTATNRVLGQAQPFIGEYGISKNPESFASEAYRVYFTDKQRGVVLRLSRDGLTPISDYGLKDYFKDTFNEVDGFMKGSYDSVKSLYNLTLDLPGSHKHPTVSFREQNNGWTSFKSFNKETGFSLNNIYYTTHHGELWRHHDNTVERNSYYYIDTDPLSSTFGLATGVRNSDSSVTVLFNGNPDIVKSFTALNYEGSQARVIENLLENEGGDSDWVQQYYNNFEKDGWYANSIISRNEVDGDQTGTVKEFINKEGKWFNYILGDTTEWENKQYALGDHGGVGNVDTQEFSVQGVGNTGAVFIDGVLCIYGCMDQTALNCDPFSPGTPGNYDPNATCHDPSMCCHDESGTPENTLCCSDLSISPPPILDPEDVPNIWRLGSTDPEINED